MAGDGRGFVLSWKGQMIFFFDQQAYRMPNCTKSTQTHFSFSAFPEGAFATLMDKWTGDVTVQYHSVGVNPGSLARLPSSFHKPAECLQPPSHLHLPSMESGAPLAYRHTLCLALGSTNCIT